MYECDKCGKVYKNRQHLWRHRKRCNSDENKDTLKCQTCNKIFHRKDMLKRHKPKCKIKERTCKICGREFQYPAFLKKHLKTHEDKKVLKCDLCGKNYKRNDQYQKHRLKCMEERNSNENNWENDEALPKSDGDDYEV